ncbi:hypothetical protein [Streptomyces sp. NPDC050704]
MPQELIPVIRDDETTKVLLDLALWLELYEPETVLSWAVPE